MKGRRIAGLLAGALLLLAVPVRPAQSVDGYFCAGNTRPQVCVHQILGFGGTIREYGITTGGPAGSGTEAYRVELMCGIDGQPLALRVGETDRGIGLGIGFVSLPLIVPSLICPDVLPQLP